MNLMFTPLWGWFSYISGLRHFMVSPAQHYRDFLRKKNTVKARKVVETDNKGDSEFFVLKSAHSKKVLDSVTGRGRFFLCEVMCVLMYDCMGFHLGASLSPTIKNMFSGLISSWCPQTNRLIKI